MEMNHVIIAGSTLGTILLLVIYFENRARIKNKNIIAQCQTCGQTTLPAMISTLLSQTDYNDPTVQSLKNSISQFTCMGDTTSDGIIQNYLVQILSSMQTMYATNSQMVTCLQHNIPAIVNQILNTNIFDDATIQSIKTQISTFKCTNSPTVNTAIQSWISTLLQTQVMLQNKLVDINTSLTSMQSQYTQKNNDIVTLTNSYNTEKAKGNTCNATLSAMQSQYQVLQSQLSDLQSKMQTMQNTDANTIASLNATIAAHTAQITAQATIQSTYTCLFSVHVVFPSYTSALFLVRRSSDNQSTQITYVNGAYVLYNSQNTPLSTWTSNTDPFIVIWYDQSGNNRHAAQPMFALQPVLVLQSNSAKFTGGSYLELPPLALPSNNDPYTLCVKWGTIKGGICGAGMPSQNSAFCLRTDTSSSMVHYWWANDLVIPEYRDNSILTITYDGTTQTSFLNGQQDATRTITNPRNNIDQPAYLGRTILNSEVLNGTLLFFGISPSSLPLSSRGILEQLSII
jgi:hypothetical protein